MALKLVRTVNSWYNIPWWVRLQITIKAHWYTIKFIYILKYKIEGCGYEYIYHRYKNIKFDEEIGQLFVDMYCQYCLGFKNHKLKKLKQIRVYWGLPTHDKRWKDWIKAEVIDVKHLGGCYVRDTRAIYINPATNQTNTHAWSTLLHESMHITLREHDYKFLVGMFRIGEFAAMLYPSLKEWNDGRHFKRSKDTRKRH